MPYPLLPISSIQSSEVYKKFSKATSTLAECSQHMYRRLELAKNLEFQSKQKTAQAQALLRTVKDIYGQDQINYNLSTQKLNSFVDRQMSYIKKNLDHQESRLRANPITATMAINNRCPIGQPDQSTGTKRKSRSPYRPRPTQGRRRSRTRSRERNNKNQTQKRRKSNSRNRSSIDRQSRVILTKFLQDLIRPSSK